MGKIHFLKTLKEYLGILNMFQPKKKHVFKKKKIFYRD